MMAVARRILLFDIDGVVIRQRSGTSWQDGLKRDLGIDPRLLQERFFAVHWSDIITGRADLLERLGPALHGMGLGMSAEEFARYWFEHDALIDHELLGTLSCLRDRGHALLLATNQEHHRARYLWNTLGLSGFFEAMHYSADLGCAKPDRLFFSRVAERLQTTGSLAPLLVDDQIANVLAAREAGWKALLWSRGTGSSGLPRNGRTRPVGRRCRNRT